MAIEIQGIELHIEEPIQVDGIEILIEDAIQVIAVELVVDTLPYNPDGSPYNSPC